MQKVTKIMLFLISILLIIGCIPLVWASIWSLFTPQAERFERDIYYMWDFFLVAIGIFIVLLHEQFQKIILQIFLALIASYLIVGGFGTGIVNYNNHEQILGWSFLLTGLVILMYSIDSTHKMSMKLTTQIILGIIAIILVFSGIMQSWGFILISIGIIVYIIDNTYKTSEK